MQHTTCFDVCLCYSYETPLTDGSVSMDWTLVGFPPLYFNFNLPEYCQPPTPTPPPPKKGQPPPDTKRLLKKKTSFISWCVKLVMMGWEGRCYSDRSDVSSLCSGPVCSLQITTSSTCQLKKKKKKRTLCLNLALSLLTPIFLWCKWHICWICDTFLIDVGWSSG